uniref:Uncharacterized protein n=1 Tax=Anguilla anguilla TaxID=7936 RepID=A0A0E9PNI1_ANGAN
MKVCKRDDRQHL